MGRPRQHEMDAELLGALASRSAGLSAAELRAVVLSHPSQPTMARRLLDLRARGKVVVEGRGRATRYHLATGNELPKLRSRLLHEVVARKLLQEPRLIERARRRLDKLRQVNPSARRYHARWSELIDGPRPLLLRAMTEDSEAAADLRQESPFTTLLEPRERQRVLQRLHS